MSISYLKVLAIISLFVGEGFGVYAEIIAAKGSLTAAQPFYIFLKSVLLIIFSAVFLIGGYIMGIRSFHNIWIVSVLSITSILLIEPVLDYVIFNQIPTQGAFVGFALAVAGFAATIFF